MSFNQLYHLAILELKFEYDFHPGVVESLQTNKKLKNMANFIYDQLICKQQMLLKRYKEEFNTRINKLTKELDVDNRCGFVVKCHNNGYKQFCNLSQENHTNPKLEADKIRCSPTVKITHQFQKKNMNHIIDQKYQEDIFSIYNFILELASLLINRLISDYLQTNSQLFQIKYNDDEKLLEYDQLVKEDCHYFRSNYLKPGNKVNYFKLISSK